MLTWTLKMPTTPLPPLLVFQTCTVRTLSDTSSVVIMRVLKICTEGEMSDGNRRESRGWAAHLQQGLLVAHAVCKEAVQCRAPRLRAQQHIPIRQHHALQQIDVVLPWAVAHIHWAATDLHQVHCITNYCSTVHLESQGCQMIFTLPQRPCSDHASR